MTKATYRRVFWAYSSMGIRVYQSREAWQKQAVMTARTGAESSHLEPQAWSRERKLRIACGF